MIAMILSNIMKLFVPLGLFIWALFMPRIAGYIYVAIYGLFEGYLFLTDTIKMRPNPNKWSTEEIKIIKKYYLALKFSFGAKDMYCCSNGFRWSGILWLILFLFNQMWIAAVFVVVSFFITASISVRLDPFFFLGQAVASGQIQFAHELSLLHQVAKKLNDKNNEVKRQKE